MRATEPAQGDNYKVECNYNECRMLFGRKYEMQRHIKVVHLQQTKMMCTVEGCGRVINRPDGLRSHLRKMHWDIYRELEVQRLNMKSFDSSTPPLYPSHYEHPSSSSFDDQVTVTDSGFFQSAPTAPNSQAVYLEGINNPMERAASKPFVSIDMAVSTTLAYFPPLPSQAVCPSQLWGMEPTSRLPSISLQPQGAQSPALGETNSRAEGNQIRESAPNLSSLADPAGPILAPGFVSNGGQGAMAMADWLVSEFNDEWPLEWNP